MVDPWRLLGFSEETMVLSQPSRFWITGRFQAKPTSRCSSRAISSSLVGMTSLGPESGSLNYLQTDFQSNEDISILVLTVIVPCRPQIGLDAQAHPARWRQRAWESTCRLSHSVQAESKAISGLRA